MNSTNKTPAKINKHSDTEMSIVWNDLSHFSLPYFELRLECPCAGCVDEITGEKRIQRESILKGVKPIEVKPVGHYAIRIQWSDGHATGMYHHDRLFEICEKKGLRLQ